VVLVVAVALAAGWGVRYYAEGRVERYSADGVTVAYPATWMPSKAADGTLRFRETQAGGSAVSITVRGAAFANAQSAAQAVAAEADALTLDGKTNWIAYRILSNDAKATFRGQPARRISYVFVEDRPDAFQQYLPVVMLGQDVVTYQNGRVYVLSLQAPQSEFARAQHYFEALLDSAAFEPR